MAKKTINLKAVESFFNKKRDQDSHKGENGKCLVIGGSRDLVGAPALAAMSALACLRSGVDIVFVASPEKPAWAINNYSPDLIVKKLEGRALGEKNLGPALSLAKKCDSVLIGPGMGRERQTLQFAKKFVSSCKKPIVVDADALFACKGKMLRQAAVITPHPHEFFEFTGKKIPSNAGLPEKIRVVKNAAARHNCIVLLKGRFDIISDGKRTLINRTGNAGMTVGGTGDVLAGLCTGFIAIGLAPFEAACAAAFVNGKIGEALFKKMGYGFTASDSIDEIPNWTKRLVK